MDVFIASRRYLLNNITKQDVKVTNGLTTVTAGNKRIELFFYFEIIPLYIVNPRLFQNRHFQL